MKTNALYKTILLLLGIILLSGCTEQYAIQTNTFEEALVVEGTLTNELKQQEIKISRTFRFEQGGPVFETGAEVSVADDQANVYSFEESNGKYVSTDAFEAQPGRTYRLNITTQDGKNYNSSGEQLTAVNEIQSLIPSVQVKNGDKGVSINVNSFDPTGSSKYYRYEYEETYKVIAPEWHPDKAILLPALPGNDHQEIGIVPRNNGETRICYSTVLSNDILQTATTDLNEDRVDFALRFISSKNPIITHRYSVKVRQYIQSLEAYTFYKTLKQLSGNGSILSQTQPGFFYGNLRCTSNPNEKVIGFFEVASVSSKRIFFNFSDLFPNDALPPYFEDCEVVPYGFCFSAANPDCKGQALISAIGTNNLLYAGDHPVEGIPTYFMVPPVCGDCTRLSSNIRPSFWID